MSLLVKKSKRLDVDYNNLYPPFPREVFFDLNNSCNLTCFFCSNSKLAKRDYLDKEFGFKLLRDFYECGTREVAFFATGEPFLRKDLADFVREAKSIGYEYVFINSNGVIATPERAQPVLEAGLDSIKFSINAGTRESYTRVHGADRFDAVIKNVKWFHEFRSKSKLPFRIYLSMVVNNRAKGELPLLTDLLKDYVDEINGRGCSNQGGNKLENNLTENIDKGNLLGSLKEGEHHYGKCPDPFARCTVTPQGYLTACVVDYQNYLVLADLHEEHIKDAWHNEAYVAFRKRHSEANLKGLICHNCLNNCQTPVQPLNPKYVLKFKTEAGAKK